MTPREISDLRNRVTRAKIAHEQNRRDAEQPTRLVPRAARCVYCGARISARHVIACAKHRGLLTIDPKYVALATMVTLSEVEKAHEWMRANPYQRVA